MNCPKCTKAVSAGARFCGSCGQAAHLFLLFVIAMTLH